MMVWVALFGLTGLTATISGNIALWRERKQPINKNYHLSVNSLGSVPVVRH